MKNMGFKQFIWDSAEEGIKLDLLAIKSATEEMDKK